MRISIVTLSFNQIKFLRDAMDSIVGQGYSDLEYIVVDPGSSDGSREVIKQYDGRISRFVFESDSGPADGLNKGFASATGDIFGYVNSDDMLLPGSLQYVSDFFEKNKNIDVLLGCGQIIDERGDIFRHVVPSRYSSLHLIFGCFEFIQQAIFFRKAAFFASGGFNSSNKICWDGELLLNLAMTGARFGRSAKELGSFRIYPSTITTSSDYKQKLALERMRLFKQIMGRSYRKYDVVLRDVLLATKWMLDPWYVYYRLSRNYWCKHDRRR